MIDRPQRDVERGEVPDIALDIPITGLRARRKCRIVDGRLEHGPSWRVSLTGLALAGCSDHL